MSLTLAAALVLVGASNPVATLATTVDPMQPSERAEIVEGLVDH